MSIINGMDDIIAHIKNQDECIKKLKEENEKLKLSNQQSIDMFNFVVKSEEEKVDKIEKLEEENTILTNYRNCMDEIQKEFNDIEDIVDVLPFMKSKEEENEELKDKVVELEGEKLELQLNKDKAVEYLKTDEQELEIYKGMVNNILIELYSAEKNDALINTDDIAEIVDYEQDKDKAKELYLQLNDVIIYNDYTSDEEDTDDE